MTRVKDRRLNYALSASPLVGIGLLLSNTVLNWPGYSKVVISVLWICAGCGVISFVVTAWLSIKAPYRLSGYTVLLNSFWFAIVALMAMLLYRYHDFHVSSELP